MTCRIALGPNDDLELILPSGRRLYVPIEHGTTYLKKILQDAARSERDKPQPGYIAEYPTQHVIEKWLTADRQAKAEAEKAEAKAEALGIDLSALDIKL